MRLSVLYVITILSSFVNAHIFMQSPPSRRNKYSEYYVDNRLVDYNIMAPLNIPGYSFPCKGYPKGPATADFYSNNIVVKLEGTAVHGGGHCQFGISYDNTNFVVLKTVIRTCLIEGMTYNVPLPSNMPSGKVTFFWTWVNAIGNREYYMECADVNIHNGQSYSNGPIVGKELIVLNLPGYPVIPEFPYLDMYDGREHILNAVDFSINPPQPQPPQYTPPQPTQQSPVYTHPQPPQPPPVYTPPQPTVYTPPQPQYTPPQPTVYTPPQQSPSVCACNNDKNGYMKCNGESFDTCVNGIWINRACAPGTACKQVGNSIVCDWK